MVEKKMTFKGLQKNWNELGKIDPFWAICTLPDKKGNKWDMDEFFETGEREVALVMEYVESLGINVLRRKALDFGCGVGRLTQPLANYFDEVYGVDIAPSMIELAKKYNRHGDKCKYYLNETDDLKLFPDNSFDFIYSSLTLQHIKPQYSKSYISEFLRILVPDGLLIFQLPSEPIPTPHGDKPNKGVKQLIKSVIHLGQTRMKKRLEYPTIEMYGINQEEVVKLLEENGAKILNIIQDQSAGPNWVSFRYCVTNISTSLRKGSIRFSSQRSNLGVETEVEAVAT